jgi:chemotaxis protein CheZ
MVSLAEVTTESLHTFFESLDKAVFRELKEIADYIGRMREEIGALQANEMSRAKIPAAGQELDAIVKSTEDASNTIMGCAENVMNAEAIDLESYRAFVEDQMMVIFEACSFQDLTGQRISKVVSTLKSIESRVSRFAEAARVRDLADIKDAREAAEEERRKLKLVHGPALAGDGNSQDVIDELISGGMPDVFADSK